MMCLVREKKQALVLAIVSMMSRQTHVHYPPLVYKQKCLFKGIVHSKMIVCWKCTHSRAIQDVEEFVSLSLHKMLLKDWS